MQDEVYLKYVYLAITGKRLNLNEPVTFSEKIQYLKLYDRKPIYSKMVDKYEVKEYVAKIIGKEYIVPTLGIYNTFDDINFELLPNEFVLKCTHDSGSQIICKDRKTLNKKALKKHFQKRLNKSYFWSGREWPYKDVKPRIIAEHYLGENLRDYKFFSFNSEIKFMYVSEGLTNHSTATISFFDLNGKQLPFKRLDYKAFNGSIELPHSFSIMKNLAQLITNNVNSRFNRIDMYCIGKQVYFSEITFSPCSGFIPFSPPYWDIILGKELKI